jgi:prepilin-type N-terminal cleavage/methylation domain-containing protein
MNTNTKRGFTLMELLVVIAIIGILASVVLASLNSARNKGADAAIKSNLNNARSQAELYYDNNNGSYATVCSNTSPQGISLQVAGAESANGAYTVTCSEDANEWVVGSQLITTGFYCVDYKGNATTTATNMANATPGGDGDRDCD